MDCTKFVEKFERLLSSEGDCKAIIYTVRHLRPMVLLPQILTPLPQVSEDEEARVTCKRSFMQVFTLKLGKRRPADRRPMARSGD